MVTRKEEKEISNDLGLLVKSSIIVFGGVFLSKILAYFYRITIARYYGPEVYGLFSLALMVIGFFIAFASLGFSEGLLRFIPIYRAKKQYSNIAYLLKFARKTLLISGIIAGIIMFLFSDFIAVSIFNEPSLKLFLQIFAFLVPIQIFSNIYLSVLRANERINAFSFSYNILQNIVKLIFIFIFILFFISAPHAIAFSYMLGIIATLSFSYLFAKVKIKEIFNQTNPPKDVSKKILQSFFSYSWPLVLFGIIGTLLFWVDTFSIGLFKDAYFVGIYNSAIPIATLMAFSGELFLQLFSPLITRTLAQKRFNVAKELSKQINKWIFIINLPLLVLILFFPGVFINFFWGADYLAAETALRFLAFGMFIFSLSSVSRSLLSSKGKSKILLINLICISAINLLLNFLLVPKYGINGAAIATMASLILLSIILFLEAYLFTKLFPIRRKMLEVSISLAIATLCLFYFRRFVQVNLLSMLLIGSFFGLIYLALLFLTKSFDKNDWEIIKKARTNFKKKIISRSF